ncbi:putative RNA-binding protein [Blattamonas nauphoetae]|uniref:RNA-binding protein n=1 Tax=Blattamonas nauphoetae TaxID=2049346 RepID=A0ABQ9XPX4_9EUKA|nr:putative RNA-binding protein [Blattamonas nauphoetae]
MCDTSPSTPGRHQNLSTSQGKGQVDPFCVFVHYLPPSCTSQELRHLFHRFGPITSSKVLVDPDTGSSLGYGFISFEKTTSAQNAVKEMDGFRISGKTLVVRLSNKQKTHRTYRPKHTLFIRHISTNATKSDVNSLFSSFGPIETMKLDNDAFSFGHSNKIAYVRFVSIHDAQRAVEELDGKHWKDCPTPLTVAFAKKELKTHISNSTGDLEPASPSEVESELSLLPLPPISERRPFRFVEDGGSETSDEIVFTASPNLVSSRSTVNSTPQSNSHPILAGFAGPLLKHPTEFHAQSAFTTTIHSSMSSLESHDSPPLLPISAASHTYPDRADPTHTLLDQPPNDSTTSFPDISVLSLPPFTKPFIPRLNQTNKQIDPQIPSPHLTPKLDASKRDSVQNSLDTSSSTLPFVFEPPTYTTPASLSSLAHFSAFSPSPPFSSSLNSFPQIVDEAESFPDLILESNTLLSRVSPDSPQFLPEMNPSSVQPIFSPPLVTSLDSNHLWSIDTSTIASNHTSIDNQHFSTLNESSARTTSPKWTATSLPYSVSSSTPKNDERKEIQKKITSITFVPKRPQNEKSGDEDKPLLQLPPNHRALPPPQHQFSKERGRKGEKGSDLRKSSKIINTRRNQNRPGSEPVILRPVNSLSLPQIPLATGSSSDTDLVSLSSPPLSLNNHFTSYPAQLSYSSTPLSVSHPHSSPSPSSPPIHPLRSRNGGRPEYGSFFSPIGPTHDENAGI